MDLSSKEQIQAGEKGQPGKGGRHGKHGKASGDVGCVDWAGTGGGGTYYGFWSDRRLKVKRGKDSKKKHVKFSDPYYESWAHIDDVGYAQPQIEQGTQEEKNCNRTREQCSKKEAVRKKAIVRDGLEQYVNQLAQWNEQINSLKTRAQESLDTATQNLNQLTMVSAQ